MTEGLSVLEAFKATYIMVALHRPYPCSTALSGKAFFFLFFFFLRVHSVNLLIRLVYIQTIQKRTKVLKIHSQKAKKKGPESLNERADSRLPTTLRKSKKKTSDIGVM